jgi:hypothetical protein
MGGVIAGLLLGSAILRRVLGRGLTVEAEPREESRRVAAGVRRR